MAAYTMVRMVASTGASWKKSVMDINNCIIRFAQNIKFADKDTIKECKKVSLFAQRCLDSSNLLSRFVELRHILVFFLVVCVLFCNFAAQ